MRPEHTSAVEIARAELKTLPPRSKDLDTDEIEGALLEAERRGEVVASLFRLLIFATMLVALWGQLGAARLTSPTAVVVGAYGIASLVGLGLAYRRIFHPVMPFVFVLIDILVLAVAVFMVARMQGMGMSAATTLPLFSLAFIVLIHTSIRYRPSLVVFGAVIFVAIGLLVPELPWLAPATQSGMMRGAGMAGMTNVANPMVHGLVPLLFVAVAAALLVYTVWRTRRLLALTLRDGERLAQLSRFFSPDVARHLVSQKRDSVAAGARREVAVLFIDIRGFTGLAEEMSPEDLSRFLSSFRETVCQTIFRFGGTVDKFIGDAVLAVFGTPTSKSDDAKQAVEASLAIVRDIRVWASSREDAGEAGATVGVGAHYGPVFAGVIQSGEILEHTVIGDVVNVAQRLERLSRSLDAEVVLSEDIIKASGLNAADLELSKEDDVELAGHVGRMTVFYGMAARGSEVGNAH